MVPQESVSSWLKDFLVSEYHQSHKRHQFNDTSFVLWEVRNYNNYYFIIFFIIINFSLKNNKLTRL